MQTKIFNSPIQIHKQINKPLKTTQLTNIKFQKQNSNKKNSKQSLKMNQISWMTHDWARSESRTRIALDQSFELQSFANSILSVTVEAISDEEDKSPPNQTDQTSKNAQN